MNKAAWGILLFSLLAFRGNAQQLYSFSLNNQNSYVLNPAITGADHDFAAWAGFRQQWLQMKDGPMTQTLGANGLVKKKNVGLGGMVLNDRTGPTAMTGLYLSYAYHIRFKKVNPFKYPEFIRKSVISIGLSATFNQYRLNADQLILDQPDDPAVASGRRAVFLPNAAAGIYYYYDYLFLGFSVPQILPLESRFRDASALSILRRAPHFYTVAGGRIPFGQSPFLLQPAVWLRGVRGAPLQADAQLRLIMQEIAWIGAAWRTSNAIVLEGGFYIKKKFRAGYAYDLQLGPLSTHLGGTHEVFLGYVIGERDIRQRFIIRY